MAAKRKPRPFWERAYKGHGYWLGKKMLGKVTLMARESRGKYHWTAGGRVGFADDLARAKAAVELAIHHAERQLDLFAAANE